MKARYVIPIAVLLWTSALAGCSPGSPLASTNSTEPPLTSSGAASPGLSIAVDFPIGSWTTTITEADLRAAGITEAGLIAENTGTFTTVFAPDGTWTTAQVTNGPVKYPVYRGTYHATGPRSFEQRTDFPPDYGGDIVTFTWSIDNGALILRVPDPPDQILPIITEAHPWQRS